MGVIPNALCFGQEFSATGVPCLVEVAPTGLTIQFAGGAASETTDSVPFSSLMVSAGGIDHDHLVVKWMADGAERTLYLKEPGLIRAFRQAAPPELTKPLEHTAEQVRRVRHTRRTALLVTGGVLAGLLLALWFGSD